MNELKNIAKDLTLLAIWFPIFELKQFIAYVYFKLFY